MIPLIPIITRAGAMLLMKQMAKRAAKKKILKDAALKKKVDKIGKKAAKKEAKKETKEKPKKRILSVGKLKGKLSTKQVAARQKLRDDVKKYRN